MEAVDRARCARENFMSGCNCPQSVVRAFDDVLVARGIDPATASRLASPFGGGMGRMREVCGAVSGMLMILGLVEGYDDPSDYDAKSELYARVQQLAQEFKAQNGSILCRELLGLENGPDKPLPEQRTEAYYDSRPCAELCASAAQILGAYLSR